MRANNLSTLVKIVDS
uniref:Uncharacterized protein n=1 Tax=Anguilla anguilla TaxID=7936 RepID=A0A0E9TIY5_ANGAN